MEVPQVDHLHRRWLHRVGDDLLEASLGGVDLAVTAAVEDLQQAVVDGVGILLHLHQKVAEEGHLRQCDRSVSEILTLLKT